MSLGFGFFAILCVLDAVLRRLRQPHLRDAQTVERFDAHLPPLDLDRVADAGAASEPPQDLTADGRVCGLVDVQAELLVDVRHEREAIDVGGPVGTDDRPRLRAGFARNLADDPLHQ